MNLFESIPETSYLTAQNVGQYRLIMRLFYQEYEKMNYQLYKEEVMELVREQPGFEEYSMEQLLLDLEALSRWKNLIQIQNPGRIYSIADYKNKQYQYVMSENAVEIERMTIRLENLYAEGGSLSANLFVRLERSLAEAESVAHRQNKDIYEWWINLQEDFKRLNQNCKDYLREFYSGKTNTLMRSVEFIMHKDRFIQYLNEFIIDLQKYSRRIAAILERIRPLVENEMLEQVVASALDIPHAAISEKEQSEEQIRVNVSGGWNSLKNWFMGTEQHEAESQKILRITQEIIRNIIQNAAMIVQIQNWGVSRKEDYQKFLELFLNAESLEEAHRISAHVFGIQAIAHLKANEIRDSDSVSSSVYEEEPCEYCLKPRVHTYKERRKQQGFGDKSMEKMLQRAAYMRKLSQEKQLVLRYIRDGRVDLAGITEIVPESVRNTFLEWIARANMSQEKIGRTEYGQSYRLIRGEGDCVLHCEDGDLRMPAYCLEFENEGDS